jgi:hypothetical protein
MAERGCNKLLMGLHMLLGDSYNKHFEVNNKQNFSLVIYKEMISK